MTKKKPKNLRLRLPARLYDEVKAAAEREMRSMNAVILLCIEERLTGEVR